MHARHYSPTTGRFIQPDPDRSEANLYAYAANNPVTEIDPDGTCFIVCVIIGAVIDTAVYMATTDSSNWNVGDAAGAVVSGAVESAVNPFAKIGKVTKLVSAAQKVYTKFSKAGRIAKLGSTSRGLKPRATNVRAIAKGEKVDRLMNELKGRTWKTGREHAIVSYGAGQRAIVRGGATGMKLSPKVKRVIAHTHPYGRAARGPSNWDRMALGRLGQVHSYLIEAGRISRYGPR
jgi:uncharacterized protein RhaS with RHS repeats